MSTVFASPAAIAGALAILVPIAGAVIVE